MQLAGDKHAAFAAASGVVSSDGTIGAGTLLELMFPKGKKKSVLAIEAAMQVDFSQKSLPSLEAFVVAPIGGSNTLAPPTSPANVSLNVLLVKK